MVLVSIGLFVDVRHRNVVKEHKAWSKLPLEPAKILLWKKIWLPLRFEDEEIQEGKKSFPQ